MNRKKPLFESLEERVCLSSSGLDALPAVDYTHVSVHAAAQISPPANLLTPAQVRHAYAIDQVKFGSQIGNGVGQTIAIVDAFNDPNIISDLAQFDTQFQLAGATVSQVGQFLKVVNQTGGAALPPVDNTNGSWEFEESQDVEWAHAVAPAAKLLLVECNSTSFNDLIGAGVNYARQQPGVVTVSMSFAGGEAPADLAFDKYFATPANHVGVTFVAATGDSAPNSGYPAVCPSVIAAAGSALRISNAAGTYAGEHASGYQGGGVSSYELQPGYQNSLVTQNQTFRTTPDVSFVGDNGTPVAVYDSYDGGPTNPWRGGSGSSLSAPAWAALIAIADQGRTLAKLAPLDGATGALARLYNLPATDFHDITDGTNGFAGGVGYDLVSGRGTPIANTLIADLIHDPVGPHVVSASVQGVSTSKVTSVQFTFSQTMNPASFSIAHGIAAFKGNNLATTVSSRNLPSQITGYQWENSNRTLEVIFKPLTINGTYTLVLAPFVEASSTNKQLDQNFNGIAGQSTDGYSVHFQIASAIGPDAFGYTATSTAYQNLSLTPGAAGVTSILANTDDGSSPVSLGGSTFNFFGKTYSSLFVDSNGFLTFGSGSAANTEYANTDLSSDPALPIIAPLWDDWTTDRAASETVLYKFTNPNSKGVPQMLVIEWDGVQNQGAFAAGPDAPATFSVALQLNTGAKAGNIIFNYASLNLNQSHFNNGGSATVGLGAGTTSNDRLLISLDNPSSPLVGTGKEILITG